MAVQLRRHSGNPAPRNSIFAYWRAAWKADTQTGDINTAARVYSRVSVRPVSKQVTSAVGGTEKLAEINKR